MNVRNNYGVFDVTVYVRFSFSFCSVCCIIFCIVFIQLLAYGQQTFLQERLMAPSQQRRQYTDHSWQRAIKRSYKNAWWQDTSSLYSI